MVIIMNDNEEKLIKEDPAPEMTPPAAEGTEERKESPKATPERGGSIGAQIGGIALGELTVNLITLIVFAAIKGAGLLKEGFSLAPVIFGGLLGTAVTVLNFLILTLNINSAINKFLALRGSKEMGDEEAEAFAQKNSMVIQNAMTRSYIIRSLLMIGVLVGAFLLPGWFNVIATLVPLVCYRPIIYLSELTKKKGRK